MAEHGKGLATAASMFLTEVEAVTASLQESTDKVEQQQVQMEERLAHSNIAIYRGVVALDHFAQSAESLSSSLEAYKNAAASLYEDHVSNLHLVFQNLSTEAGVFQSLRWSDFAFNIPGLAFFTGKQEISFRRFLIGVLSLGVGYFYPPLASVVPRLSFWLLFDLYSSGDCRLFFRVGCHHPLDVI